MYVLIWSFWKCSLGISVSHNIEYVKSLSENKSRKQSLKVRGKYGGFCIHTSYILYWQFNCSYSHLHHHSTWRVKPLRLYGMWVSSHPWVSNTMCWVVLCVPRSDYAHCSDPILVGWDGQCYPHLFRIVTQIRCRMYDLLEPVRDEMCLCRSDALNISTFRSVFVHSSADRSSRTSSYSCFRTICDTHLPFNGVSLLTNWEFVPEKEMRENSA